METLKSIENIKEIVNNTNLQHIAIIMDGNRRWAKNKFLATSFGHKQGVEALKTVLKSCKKFGIKYLTVYAFSTENWNRTIDEVSFLMSLLAKTIVDELPLFQENNIKLSFVGSRLNLKDDIIKVIEFGEEQTKNNDSLHLQIAFNYGSRDEIVNAVKSICDDVKAGTIKIENISENLLSSKLYTKFVPDPDLLIRTGGEQRISNYLLWQSAYSELYFTQTLWPDFNEDSLIDSILEFNSRNRRFGK